MADMAEISRPELCIVGAGALGIALAQHARRLGSSVTLVDRGGAEAGDGPQRALRVAALAASAAGAAAMRRGAALGLAAVDPKVNLKAVQERTRQLVAERAVLDSPERLAAVGIDYISGPAHFADSATLVVGETQIKAQAYLLALGGQAVVPDIAGLEMTEHFTPDTLLDNVRKLTHLLVIGSDAEGLALAQAYARLGSDVTVVPQGRALAGFDLETASIWMQALAEDGVRVIDGARVRHVQPRSQGIGAIADKDEGGEVSLDLSHILVADGRVASISGLGLDTAGVRPVRGQAMRYATGALGQTSNRRVRVAGIAAGIDQWQQSLAHGRSVVEALVAGRPRHRPAAPARLVLTEPPLAQIGRLPADTARLAPGHVIIRANLSENDMLSARGEAKGLIKVLADAKGRILGASVVGTGAADLAGVLALAMDRGIPVDALADIPLPHPSHFASVVALAENRMAERIVSPWEKRRGALRRLIGL
ncbi:FAD-dependent oxidoreductase [Devosia sediminis]|uniref:NAD(P)/FAD-dependent oxidoreductase n=1 Tax=Devosia sediminis TaxID=2798801 RepID=A0A934J252_9HYPH|nr:FAD-dependent oxidoreductase [Devosia sediminis]MBJ3786853.1 NAD(P)/FAD-dependent oxidoreductase [Devosia sediminis]